MKSIYSQAEKFAGLFLLLGFGLLLASVLLVGIGNDWFRSYNHYFTLFKEGYGLSQGVKVKFLRTDVGRIVKLEITDSNQVKIYIDILNEYADRIKGDSRAEIKSPTLIGSEYIDIVPGGLDSFPIPVNGQIPAIDPKTMDDILATLGPEEKLHQLEAIMKDLGSLTNQLQDPNGPLIGTMSNVRQITGQVAAGEGTLGGLITREEAYKEIIALLRDLKEVSQSLASSAAVLDRDIPDMTDKINTILNQVEQGTRSFPEVARGAREGLRDVHQVLDSAKKNILIRGNIERDPPPESLSRPAREH